MLALVTGAAGFAGSHLCEMLIGKGYNVRGLVSNVSELQEPWTPRLDGVEYVSGDLLDFESLMKATRDVDYVFHLAAITNIPETQAKQDLTWEVNAGGTAHLLLACKHNHVSRFHYASTCHVYGKSPDLPFLETTKPEPVDVYGMSKLAGEEWCKIYAKNFTHMVITRAFNHFGPRQRLGFLFPDVIKKIIDSLREQLKAGTYGSIQLGASQPTRDYLPVEDIVSGYIDAIERGKHGEVYQLCFGHEKQIWELVHDITQHMGYLGAVVYKKPDERYRTDLNRSFGAFGKASADLGWTPKKNYEKALNETIAWYRQVFS